MRHHVQQLNWTHCIATEHCEVYLFDARAIKDAIKGSCRFTGTHNNIKSRLLCIKHGGTGTLQTLVYVRICKSPVRYAVNLCNLHISIFTKLKLNINVLSFFNIYFLLEHFKHAFLFSINVISSYDVWYGNAVYIIHLCNGNPRATGRLPSWCTCNAEQLGFLCCWSE